MTRTKTRRGRRRRLTCLVLFSGGREGTRCSGKSTFVGASRGGSSEPEQRHARQTAWNSSPREWPSRTPRSLGPTIKDDELLLLLLLLLLLPSPSRCRRKKRGAAAVRFPLLLRLFLAPGVVVATEAILNGLHEAPLPVLVVSRYPLRLRPRLFFS